MSKIKAIPGLLDDLEKGIYSIPQLVEKYDVLYNTLWGYCDQHNIKVVSGINRPKKSEKFIESISGLVEDLKSKNYSIPDIVKKYENVTGEQLHKYCNSKGIIPAKHKVPSIIESIPELMKDLDIGELCVQELVEKYESYNIKYDNLWAYVEKHDIVLKKRRRFFNEKFFFTWTAELCYILGWMVSDGSVSKDNRFEIEIKVDDKEILESIGKHISMTKPVREQLRIVKSKAKGKEHEDRECRTARFTLFSKLVCDKFREWGIVPNKTLVVKWIEEIPLEFEHDFIRGIFDGDGSVFISKNKLFMSICGTYELLEQIQNRLSKPTRFFGSLHKGHGNVWELTYSNVKDLEKIYYYMYHNSKETTRLRRKYERFRDWFNVDIDEELII